MGCSLLATAGLPSSYLNLFLIRVINFHQKENEDKYGKGLSQRQGPFTYLDLKLEYKFREGLHFQIFFLFLSKFVKVPCTMQTDCSRR